MERFAAPVGCLLFPLLKYLSRKDRKEIFKTSRTSSAAPHLRVSFSGSLRQPGFVRLLLNSPPLLVACASLTNVLSRKERKERKDIFKTSRTSSAPPQLRVKFSGSLRTPVLFACCLIRRPRLHLIQRSAMI